MRLCELVRVPNRFAYRFVCPVLYSYAFLTRWPKSYTQTLCTRKTLGVLIRKLNLILSKLNVIRGQRLENSWSAAGKLQIYETIPGCRAVPMQAKTDSGSTGGILSRITNSIKRIVRSPSTLKAPNDQCPSSAREKAAISIVLDRNRKYIFFLHGGAFTILSPNAYEMFLNELSRKTNTVVLSPYYLPAPEKTWPCQIQQSFEMYKHVVLVDGIKPENIICMGDSAGGNLTVTLLMRILKFSGARQLPSLLPAGAVLMSPWLDLTCTGVSYTKNRKSERLLPYKSVQKTANVYVKGVEAFKNNWKQPKPERLLYNPWVSPVFLSDSAILGRMPPMTIHSGSTELLLSDSLTFARKINAAISGDLPNECQLGELPDEKATPPDDCLAEDKDNAFYQSIGWLDSNEFQVINQQGFVFPSGADGTGDQRALLKIWKNEIHAFPVFGIFEEPSSSQWLDETSTWIATQYERATS